MAYPLGMGGYPNKMYSPVNVGVPNFSGSELSHNSQDVDFKKVLEAAQAQMPKQPAANVAQQQQNFQGRTDGRSSGIDPLTGAFAMGGAAGAGYHAVKGLLPELKGEHLVKQGVNYEANILKGHIATDRNNLKLIEEIEKSVDESKLSAEAKALKDSGMDIAKLKESSNSNINLNETKIKALAGKSLDGVDGALKSNATNWAGEVKSKLDDLAKNPASNETWAKDINKYAKGRYGKIAAAAMALGVLAYMSFKD